MGAAVHYRDPVTTLVACGERTSWTSGVRENVTCPGCLAMLEMPPRPAASASRFHGAGSVCQTLRGGGDAAVGHVDKDGKLIFFEGPDAQWLNERGEDPASLRALVEAVDAAQENILGSELDAQGRRLWYDTRARFVSHLSSCYPGPCEVCGGSESSTRCVCVDCYGDEDPGDESVEDVPLGGLSHEDAHYVFAGVRTAADALDAASAWPDDARRWARYLRNLLKGQ